MSSNYCRYLGHMTLIANHVGVVANRRKAVRGFLESSTEWRHYCDTYLKVGTEPTRA